MNRARRDKRSPSPAGWCRHRHRHRRPCRRRCYRTSASDDADANDLNVATHRDVTWHAGHASTCVSIAACMNPEKPGEEWPVRPRPGLGDPAHSWQLNDSLKSGRDQDGATGVLTLAEGRSVSWTSPSPAGDPSIMSREFYVPCTPYTYQVSCRDFIIFIRVPTLSLFWYRITTK